MIKRLAGDAETIVLAFELILESKHKYEEEEDDLILHQLRKIVDKADYISNKIEKEFR